MDGDGATAAGRSRAADGSRSTERFDWLEGATGVCVRLAVAQGLVVITVAGDPDRASLGVIETIALRTLAVSPARVELDLRQVSCFGDDVVETVGRVWARARIRRIPFFLIAPAARGDLLERDG